MSTMNISACADIVIPNGTADSNTVSMYEQYSDADYITIMAPSALAAGESGTIMVSFDGTTWFTLSNNVSDISYPVASKAIEYVTFSAPYFKLHVTGASGTVAATRTFKMWKAWRGC